MRVLFLQNTNKEFHLPNEIAILVMNADVKFNIMTNFEIDFHQVYSYFVLKSSYYFSF